MIYDTPFFPCLSSFHARWCDTENYTFLYLGFLGYLKHPSYLYPLFPTHTYPLNCFVQPTCKALQKERMKTKEHEMLMGVLIGS